MREILFRAKREDNGEWTEGCLLEHRDMNRSPAIPRLAIEWEEKGAMLRSFIIPDTIEQFTGFTDRNGKKIFEGDIVLFQFDNDGRPFSNKDTEKGLGRISLSFFRASFVITMGKRGGNYFENILSKYVQNGNRVEVIGNIHDNPELLEAEALEEV